MVASLPCYLTWVRASEDGLFISTLYAPRLHRQAWTCVLQEDEKQNKTNISLAEIIASENRLDPDSDWTFFFASFSFHSDDVAMMT